MGEYSANCIGPTSFVMATGKRTGSNQHQKPKSGGQAVNEHLPTFSSGSAFHVFEATKATASLNSGQGWRRRTARFGVIIALQHSVSEALQKSANSFELTLCTNHLL